MDVSLSKCLVGEVNVVCYKEAGQILTVMAILENSIETIEELQNAKGLRMVGIRGVPSPWTESAKAIFLVKNLDYRYAERGNQSGIEELVAWVGHGSIPVVAFENEVPRFDWLEILSLAERIEPSPRLLAEKAELRTESIDVAATICGKMGLGWCYRLLMINQALSSSVDSAEVASGAFPKNVALYLAEKYGYEASTVADARSRVMDVLTELSSRLESSRYVMADEFSAVDIYWAMFSNLMMPLDEPELEFDSRMRPLYDCTDNEILDCISPKLREHQRFVFETHLTLPWRV